MFIVYYDESGDDGYPEYSSPLFILSATYLYYLNWKEIFNIIYEFRKELKKDFNLPLKWEFHTKYFILNKKPYKQLKLSNEQRILLIDLFCELIAQIEVRIINVIINKKIITSPNYKVLDTALKYSIQRIENDLIKIDPAKKFIIITDPGRIGKMRATARRIQKINYIPSKYNPMPYRKEIKLLIEDPLEKVSKQSYFIQLSDLISYIVYLYAILNVKKIPFPKRIPPEINKTKIINWMDKLKNSFNLEASREDPYGIVWHPK